MLLFVIPILLMSSGASSYNSFRPDSRSAASEAQIRFAIENKYDETGPGAKGREFAYNTFKTLDEALVGYLDDPDTKLPEHERVKAVQTLISSQKPYYKQERPSYPFSQNNGIFKNSNIDVNVIHSNPYHGYHSVYVKKQELERPKEDPFSFHKIQSVKNSPLNLAHFTRGPVAEEDKDFNPNPKYSFSYGVHDKRTGDSKSAHETRDGGVVHGFYTFVDADGKQRIVHYTADDHQGFRAVVRRTATNSQ